MRGGGSYWKRKRACVLTLITALINKTLFFDTALLMTECRYLNFPWKIKKIYIFLLIGMTQQRLGSKCPPPHNTIKEYFTLISLGLSNNLSYNSVLHDWISSYWPIWFGCTFNVLLMYSNKAWSILYHMLNLRLHCILYTVLSKPSTTHGQVEVII